MSIKNPPQTPERQKLQAEAMRHMRAARDAIDPVLLERARDMILKGAPSLAPQSQSVKDGPVDVMADEPVDKVKTLTVLKEFLLLKQDNKTLCGEIRTMLTTTDKR